MYIIAIDPGTSNLGVAVLEDGIPVLEKHVQVPVKTSKDRVIPLLYKGLRSLSEAYKPKYIAFEDYVWQGTERTSANAPAMWQLLGAIRVLSCLNPDSPSVWPFAPQWWHKELTGNPLPSKIKVARIVEQRIGRHVVQKLSESGGGHITDAIGVGLVLNDYHIMAEKLKVPLRELYQARRKKMVPQKRYKRKK